MIEKDLSYVVIIPAKNEDQYIKKCIDSLIAQTVKPSRLVIVDDGSEDKTYSICIDYANKYEWITVLKNDRKQKRDEGTPVVNAFLQGYQELREDFDVICKLDADIIFPTDYFERVLFSFSSNNKIGICGGQCLEEEKGEWVQKVAASYHIRGALKAYRKECYNDIGGLKPVLGWDGIDEMNAMYLGWETKVIDGLWVKHLRATASDYNKIELANKMGRANYKNGGGFFLAFVRAVYRVKRKPYFLFGLSYLKGYVLAYFKKEEKNVSSDLANFINNFHKKRFFFIKK